MSRVAIIWLRRDLRLADNAALILAAERAERTLFVYVYAPDEEAPWSAGAASRWWLHRSLDALSKQIRAIGGELIFRRGPTLDTLQNLVKETGAELLVWNRLYDPAIVTRDAHIKTTLRREGVEVHSCNSALLFEPWDIQLQTGKSKPRPADTTTAHPYKVFTPFWRRCMQQFETLPPPQSAPKKLLAPEQLPHSESLASFELLPKIKWHAGFSALWFPGETGAQETLDRFIANACDRYAVERDDLGSTSTSHLSPHLHFGEIGPRQLLAALQTDATAKMAGRETFIRELGWREFAHHVLYHFPHTATHAFDTRFDNFSWEENSSLLKAWQQGRTGFPVIDAAMRELWHTGYMHNRARMLVASLLTKNLRIHWLNGARWFWDTLVDADLANNTLGWQWTAGCGTDAAPYFRIFNPTLQSKRFDPHANYLRRWLPELTLLPDRYIHAPMTAPDAVLAKANVRLGEHYPRPIVDLKHSRAAALSSYKALRR